jgi:rhodanese-related sulfurtransferase
LTTSSDPSSAPSVLGWLRRLVGRRPDDGRLRPTVKAARALDLVRDGATLLDVRESSEWKSGHAPGAVHVALGNIDQAPKRLRQDRPVVVMCATGVRSRSAGRHLRGSGFDATSLSGGIGAWQRAGGAVGR